MNLIQGFPDNDLTCASWRLATRTKDIPARTSPSWLSSADRRDRPHHPSGRQIDGQTDLWCGLGRLDRVHGVEFDLDDLDRVCEVEIEVESEDPDPSGAGIGQEISRLWARGFGVWAGTDDRDQVLGCEYRGGGIAQESALGCARRLEGAHGPRAGVSAAIYRRSAGNTDGRTNVEIDTVGVGFWDCHPLPGGLFLDAGLACGQAMNDYIISLIGEARNRAAST
jgi:hypothetical protein